MFYRIYVHDTDHERLLEWIEVYRVRVLADVAVANGRWRLDVDGPADAIDAICVVTDLADVAIAITVVEGEELPPRFAGLSDVGHTLPH